MTQEIDADLGLQERKRRSQSLPIRVRTVSVGRQAQNQAEKSHPTKNQRLRWVRFRCGTETYRYRSCGMMQRRGTGSQQSLDG